MNRTEVQGAAVGAIHDDLLQIRRRRLVSVLAYVALIALFIGGLATAKGPVSVERDAPWIAALLLLFVGSSTATAIAVGFPLVQRRVFYVAGVGAGAAMLAGLALAVRPSLAGGAIEAGTKCFVFGSVVSSIAMVLLGVMSGRLWRRFPNPGLFLAVGVTGVGLAALHLRCPSTEAPHIFGFHLTPLILLYVITRVAVWLREDLLRHA